MGKELKIVVELLQASTLPYNAAKICFFFAYWNGYRYYFLPLCHLCYEKMPNNGLL
jgi:hypothetical protein